MRSQDTHVRRALRVVTTSTALVALSITALPAAADGPAARHSRDNISSSAVDVEDWVVGTIAGSVERSSHGPDPIGFVLQEDRVFPDTPTDRYEISKGCYALTEADGTVLLAALRMQATDLGTYMFFTADEQYVTASGATTGLGGTPGPVSEWLVDEVAGGFTVQHPDTDQIMTATGGTITLVDAGSDVVNFSTGEGDDAVGPDAAGIDPAGATAVLSFRADDGCATYPEPQVNIDGAQPTGDTSYEEVSGYIDGHVHWMAFEFIGGEIRCGRPWHRYGVTVALVDCPDHETGGVGEAAVSSPEDAFGHDTVGWPTFVDWPAEKSLTHEAMYHSWAERAWRGGLRLAVNLLVDNETLCEVYPLKRNPCDETNTLRLEYAAIREMERYIDAQYGGPGHGWMTVVTDPFEARAVMNSGRLAVVNGIETSEPFGCSLSNGVAQCDEQTVVDHLDEFTALGISQMELLNKFDNAFAGVTGDGGTTGVATNGGNFISSGRFLDMQPCPDDYHDDQHDKTQANLDDIDSGFRPAQDALFGDVAGALPLGGFAPLYASPPHCNTIGLLPMGEFIADELMARGVLIDPDHMSVKSRIALLDRIDAAGYQGVISSHGWSEATAYEKIIEMGGIVTPRSADADTFAARWAEQVQWMDDRYVFGIGFGADTNGFGGQPGPRGADVANPVVYPHTGFGGVTVNQNVSGERVYDVNVDGVDHYGLHADWFEELRQEGGDAMMADMARGPEAYLQVWERAKGAVVDRCREDTGAATDVSVLQVGMSSEETVYAFGQPTTRVDDQHTWCIPLSDGTQATVTGFFDAEGHLFAVEGGEPAPAPEPTATETPTAGEQLPATGWNLTSWTFLLMGLSLAGYRSLVRRPS